MDISKSLSILVIQISIYLLFAMCIEQFNEISEYNSRVFGNRSGGSGSIPGTTRKK
jgi:hypothetical protein